jgi:hypothetical protein
VPHVDGLKGNWEYLMCWKKNLRFIKYEVKELKKRPPEVGTRARRAPGEEAGT